MLPENIERFVDRLCALYPGTQLARNTIKAGWREDKELRQAPVDLCRSALLIIEKDGHFPSLHRVKQVIKQLKPKEETSVCPVCCGSGWDDGMNTINERYTEQLEDGSTRTYVKMCPCRRGSVNETTMALQPM